MVTLERGELTAGTQENMLWSEQLRVGSKCSRSSARSIRSDCYKAVSGIAFNPVVLTPGHIDRLRFDPNPLRRESWNPESASSW